jgi:type II secretory pathway pseudopilin PulG
MLKLFKRNFRRAQRGTAEGFSLVEVAIAIVLLAIVVGGVLTAMTTVFNMQAHQDQQRIAEYLAKNEFEYINTLPYIWGNLTGSTSQYPPQYDKVRSTQTSPRDYYYLDVRAVPIGNSSNPDRDCCPDHPCPLPPYEPLCVLHDPSGTPYVNDEGIQEIIISVYSGSHSSGPVLVTTNYKVHKFAGN